MSTNYNSADFSQLYSQYQSGGVIDDFKRFRPVLDIGSECSFFPNLNSHIGSLESGCKILSDRLAYLKIRQAEVDRLISKVGLTSSLDELQELHRRLNVIAVELFLKGVGVMEIHSLITDYRHILTQRVVAVMSARMSPQPCEFAWFNMGSDGRREQTFFTDQDNALVYEVDGSTEVEGYFKDFADQVVHDLDTAGFALCTGNIMPVNDDWRGSYARWREEMEEVFSNQVQENLLRIIILMDVTFCAGMPEVGERFINKVHTMIQQHFDALMTMARSAVMSSVAIDTPWSARKMPGSCW
jgi:signal-transduction protein with cAMP-binding, CBS, and nucleotidyltransferase domain